MGSCSTLGMDCSQAGCATPDRVSFDWKKSAQTQNSAAAGTWHTPFRDLG